MSTSPMAARERWIYGECLKIRMMVPGAAAPGKQPGKQSTNVTDGQTDNTALCTKVHRAVKSFLSIEGLITSEAVRSAILATAWLSLG